MKNIFAIFLLFYLRFFARIALAIHNPRVIGITGSVGKSSARNAIYAILKDYLPTKMLEKGNSETGIPLGILGLAMYDYSFCDWMRVLMLAPFSIFYLSGTKYLIIEMGIDEPDPPKNMGYLLTIVKPEIAVLLNIFPVHIQQFKTVERIAEEKAKIITESGCKIGIFNNDNQYISDRVKIYNLRFKNKKTKLWSFGEEKKNDISYEGYEVSLEGTEFSFSNELRLFINGYALPKEYREIFAAAILVGKSVGLSHEQIKKGLENNFSSPAGRATLLQGIKNSIIIDSSYNASKASVTAFLDLAYELAKKYKKKVVFLFGDMRELGDKAEEEHQEVAKKIALGVDYLYCVGPLTRKYVIDAVNSKQQTIHTKKSEFTVSRLPFKEMQWFLNSTDAGKHLAYHMPDNAIILVKGSQNTIFLEEAIKPILENISDISKLCRQSEYWMKKKTV